MFIDALFAAAAVHFHFIETTVTTTAWLCSAERALANCQATRVSQTKLGLRLQIKCIARVSPSQLFPFPPGTHLNCINNVQSKKFNDCRCRHLSLLARRCLRPRPPHHSSAHARKLDRWRVKFMGRRQSDRNLSLNAVRLNNVAPTAMDAADMQRMQNVSARCTDWVAVTSAVATCILQFQLLLLLLIKNKFRLQANTLDGLCVSVCSCDCLLMKPVSTPRAAGCGVCPLHAAYAQYVCAPDTADKPRVQQ